MRNKLRTTAVAVVASVCVAMSAGVAQADGGAAVGKGDANGEVIGFKGATTQGLISDHSEGGKFGALWW